MTRAMLCAALAAFALPAFPQKAEEDAVVVNATRFPEDARRLPASVTVLERDDIARSAARTLPELLQEQAGITMKDFFGNNATSTSIDLRGFGITGSQNTLVLLDGRRITDIDLTTLQWSAIPLAGIERIEILRGMGAVLYGDGATTGVINIVTRSPLLQGMGAEILGRTSAFNTQEGQLYLRYGNSVFGANASIYGLTSDGYRANNRNEQQNNTVNLRWGAGSTMLDLRLGTDSQDIRLPGARRIQPSANLNEYEVDRRGAQTPLDFASQDGNRAGATLSHRLGEADLSVGMDYRTKHQRSAFVQQARALETLLRLGSVTPRARIPFGTGPWKHSLTLGADFHSWDYDSRRDPSINNLGQPLNRLRGTQRTRAFYFQDTIDVAASTQLALGWRGERVRYQLSDTLDPAAPGFACPFPPFCPMAAAPASAEQRERAWEIGLRHAFSTAWAGFLRANRSFRFVNIDEANDFDEFGNPQFQILNPQSARTHEAGLEWRNRGHFARAALFQTDVGNEIHLDPFTAGVGNTNLPPSRRRGLELEGRWQATPALRLSAGYTYTDARYREGVLAGGAFVIGTNMSIAGKRVPLVPEHKLNAGFSWDIGARTRLSGNLTALSRQYMDTDEPNTLNVMIPSYGVADVKLSHEFGRGRVSFAINNLFDEQYYNYAVRSFFVADRYAVYPLPGRTAALTVEFKLE